MEWCGVTWSWITGSDRDVVVESGADMAGGNEDVGNWCFGVKIAV